MGQTTAIIDRLKKALKENGKTYQDVAQHLRLSEASVKRLFSEKQFSLRRLDQVCEMLGIEISDLLREMHTISHISQLTVEQEQLLVSDAKLLLAAISVLNRWSFDEILAVYDYSYTELIGCMARLDAIRLIELLPGNRTKALVTYDFKWIKNGPIQRFFEGEVQREFLNCRFDQPGEIRLFVTGMLSRNANELMQQKLKRLIQDFRHYHQEDLTLPLPERHGTSMVVAMRPWELEVFGRYRRDESKKVFR
ncbi:MAG: helix-turn-helix transcriptional regulator [Pseudomonadales bacterium]|nr:helix-turn-helix transcriptional regulator [Pseudomonadales bacterium]